MDKERNHYQKVIARVLGTRPIAFNPDLAKALHSAKAGLLLSQLLFWWGKGKNPEIIYKTIREIEDETSLSRDEQDGAIKVLKKHQLIETELKGLPAKRHFTVYIDKVIKFLEDYYKQQDREEA